MDRWEGGGSEQGSVKGDRSDQKMARGLDWASDSVSSVGEPAERSESSTASDRESQGTASDFVKELHRK